MPVATLKRNAIEQPTTRFYTELKSRPTLLWNWTMRSPVGQISLASDGERLCGLQLVAGSADSIAPSESKRDRAPFREVLVELSDYFDGSSKAFKSPIGLFGTAFQHRVWRDLLKIPYGSTISYAQLAARIGHPAAVRAVGAANGRNPISIIVPCHRVLGSGGQLTGYSGGVEGKRWLLGHESSTSSTTPSDHSGTARSAHKHLKRKPRKSPVQTRK